MASLKELEAVESKLKKQLKNIDFASLISIKSKEEGNSNNNKQSKFNKKRFSNVDKSKSLEKRKSKQAPIEKSSRVPLQTDQIFFNEKKIKQKSRDPRFDSFAGKVNMDLFHKSYSFIEPMKKEEIKNIEIELKTKKKTLSEEEKTKLRNYLGKLKNDLHQKNNFEFKAKAKKNFAEAKQSNFHVKKKILKERILIEKFKNLDAKALDNKLSNKKKQISQNKFVGLRKIQKGNF